MNFHLSVLMDVSREDFLLIVATACRRTMDRVGNMARRVRWFGRRAGVEEPNNSVESDTNNWCFQLTGEAWPLFITEWTIMVAEKRVVLRPKLDVRNRLTTNRSAS